MPNQSGHRLIILWWSLAWRQGRKWMDNWQRREGGSWYRKLGAIFKTCLNPGDVLINPSWWWHAVKNVTDETIGCATRWLVPMRNSNPLYTFTTMVWCRPRILSQFAKALFIGADPRMKDTVGRNNYYNYYRNNNYCNYWMPLFHRIPEKIALIGSNVARVNSCNIGSNSCNVL